MGEDEKPCDDRPCTSEIIRRVNEFVDSYDGPRFEAMATLGITGQHLSGWNLGKQVPSGPMLDRLMVRLKLTIAEACQ